MTRYLVTTGPSVLSSPHSQPILFLILSSPLLLGKLLLFFLCLLSLSYLLPSFSHPFYPLFFLFLLCFFTLLYFVSPSLFSSSSPFLLIPFHHSLFYPFDLGLVASIKVFSHPSSPFSLSFISLISLISLSPLSSHFHAARWAAMLCVFISVCGRGGGLVPATNGLLENTDSHASQSGELGREGGRIWSEAEGRVVLGRDGGRHTRDRVVVVVEN